MSLLLCTAGNLLGKRLSTTTVSARGTSYPDHAHNTPASVTLYVTGRKSDTAVLYLTDVFGIQLDENKLYECLP